MNRIELQNAILAFAQEDCDCDDCSMEPESQAALLQTAQRVGEGASGHEIATRFMIAVFLHRLGDFSPKYCG